MRTIIFAILVAAPTALITWIVCRGVYGPAREDCVSAPAATAARAPATASAPMLAAPPAAEPVAVRAAKPAAAAGPDLDLKLLSFSAGLPAKFVLRGKPTLYDDKGLFDYIDGAAPIFIERHFRRLAAAELTTTDGGELVCDIYDMQSADNAASIFAKERPASALPLAVGDEGHHGRMSAGFRRGRYYVKLTAFNAVGDKALSELAPLVAAKMP